MELAFGASNNHQTNIRLFLWNVLRMYGHKIGNAFLMSCMLRPFTHKFHRPDRPSKDPATDDQMHLVYKVPELPLYLDVMDKDIFGGECRAFFLCREQFKSLFGLTEGRLNRLHKQRTDRMRVDGGWIKDPKKIDKVGPFHWEDKDHFVAFEERYSVMAIENEWDDVRANAISYLPIQPYNDEDPESKCENDYQCYNNTVSLPNKCPCMVVFGVIVALYL